MLFNSTEVFSLGAGIFSGGEAKLLSAEGFHSGSLHSLAHFAFLRKNADSERILCLGKDVVAIACACLNEWTFGVLRLLVETVVKHLGDAPFAVIVNEIHHAVLFRFWEWVVLVHHLHDVHLLFLILVNHDDGFGVVRHLFVNHLSRIGSRSRNSAEHFLNLLHGVVHIDVAHHNHGLVVGAIPFLIVVADFVVFEIVDHAHQADRHTLAILRAWVELFEVAFEHTLACRRAQTPFLVNHATFLVDFLALKQQTV